MRTNPATPFAAGAAVLPRRIVKHGAADGLVIQAAAATDKLLGVSDSLGATAANDSVSVYLSGDAVEIDVGGVIARGSQITADADGKAVVAAPAAGATCRTIGIALKTYASGDVGEFRLSPGSVTTPA